MWRGSQGISEQFQTRGETRRRDLIEMFPSSFCEAVVVPPLRLPHDRLSCQQATGRVHLAPSALVRVTSYSATNWLLTRRARHKSLATLQPTRRLMQFYSSITSIEVRRCS